MGIAAPPMYGKSNFYEEKKAKALKIIAEQEAIIEECDKELAKIEDEDK